MRGLKEKRSGTYGMKRSEVADIAEKERESKMRWYGWVIGNFRFATATKSGTTTRFLPLNICYYRLFIVLSFAYHIFIATVAPNHVLL